MTIPPGAATAYASSLPSVRAQTTTVTISKVLLVCPPASRVGQSIMKSQLHRWKGLRPGTCTLNINSDQANVGEHPLCLPGSTLYKVSFPPAQGNRRTLQPELPSFVDFNTDNSGTEKPSTFGIIFVFFKASNPWKLPRKFHFPEVILKSR